MQSCLHFSSQSVINATFPIIAALFDSALELDPIYVFPGRDGSAHSAHRLIRSRYLTYHTRCTFLTFC